AISRFDIEGNLNSTLLSSSYSSHDWCYSNLDIYEKKIYTSTYLKIDKFKKTTLLNFSEYLDLIDSSEFDSSSPSSSIYNEGLVAIQGFLYLYGSVINTEVGVSDSLEIIKVDTLGNEIWRNYYTFGNDSMNLRILDLQPCPDDCIAFSIKQTAPVGATHYRDSVRIVKIDTSGNLLNQFLFEDSSPFSGKFLTTSDNGFVFASTNSISNTDVFPSGIIHKLNHDMETIEWSLELPNDQLVDGRLYRVHDYLQDVNGDILVCGMVFDNSDTEIGDGIPDVNSTWNGFIIRLNIVGEILWIRLFKQPNNLLDIENFGRFRPSRLNKIVRLSENKFAAAGEVYLTANQAFNINELDTEGYHLWLLVFDGQGCIDGYQCDEIIRISLPSINHDFTLIDPSHQWTEVSYDFQGNPTSQRYRFASDSSNIGGSWYYELLLSSDETGDTFNGTSIFLREVDESIYFIDDNEEFLFYDFSLMTGDTFTVAETQLNPEVDLLVVDIDSIELQNGTMRKRLYLRCLNNPGGDPTQWDRIWIEGIGDTQGLLSPSGSCLFDQNSILTCFSSNGETLYKAENEDECWISTSINELEKYGLSLYPNPARNYVEIGGVTEWFSYQLFCFDGTLVRSGESLGRIDLSRDLPGSYVLEINYRGNRVPVRIIKR
ncbi:MAG: hypothetical protein AAGF87_13795, partial [Bacteroidota bacterium]